MFLIEANYPPYSDDWVVLLTVKHVIIECHNYYRESTRYFGAGIIDDVKAILTGCNASIQVNLKQVLSDIVLEFQTSKRSDSVVCISSAAPFVSAGPGYHRQRAGIFCTIRYKSFNRIKLN